jgi:hypothetical protein
MTMPAPPGYQQQGQGSAGVTDAVSQLSNIARQLGLWVLAFKGRNMFGSFTTAVAPTTTVSQPAVQANSLIFLSPTNAAAATLQGSAQSLYIKSISPGVSFTVATASGSNATAATFSYVIETPS